MALVLHFDNLALPVHGRKGGEGQICKKAASYRQFSSVLDLFKLHVHVYSPKSEHM